MEKYSYKKEFWISEETIEVKQDYQLLAQCIDKAKNRNQDKSAYTKEKLAEVINVSLSTFDRIKSGKRKLSLEEKTKLANYLSVSLEDIDPLLNNYYRARYKEMFGEEPEDMDWVNSYEGHCFINEDKQIAKKQVEKMSRWFNTKLTMKERYRLVTYIEIYQNIDDSVFEFFLYYSALSEEEKLDINERIDERFMCLGSIIDVPEIFFELSQCTTMINLTDEKISAIIKSDEQNIVVDKTINDRSLEYRKTILAEKLLEKYTNAFEEICNIETHSYISIEKLYQRFWMYISMTKEDWKIIARFKLLRFVEKKGYNTYQDYICQKVHTLVENQNKSKSYVQTDFITDETLNDNLVLTEDFCIIPLGLAKEEDMDITFE